MLAHHASGKKSADTYARDVLASPLRSFDHVLQQIRQGVFPARHDKIRHVKGSVERRSETQYQAPEASERDDDDVSSSISSESEEFHEIPLADDAIPGDS